MKLNWIYNNGKRTSAVEIIRMRGTYINRKIVEMTISNKGMMIYPGKMLGGVHTKLKLT